VGNERRFDGFRLACVRCSHCRRKPAVMVAIFDLLSSDLDPELLEIAVLNRQRTIVDNAHFAGYHNRRSTARPLDRSTARPLDRSTARPLDRSTARRDHS